MKSRSAADGSSQRTFVLIVEQGEGAAAIPRSPSSKA